MKRVLLTGASGFIGRQAIDLLQAKGYDVFPVTSQTADLLDPAQRKTLIERVQPTHILHFAWIATPGVYWTSPLNERWQEATLDLLKLAKEHGVQRFVGSGTCAEYPLYPETPYGKAKAATGEAVIAEQDLSTAWGRIFLLYGPHEHPSRLVPSVILSLLKGEIAKCTHGNQLRDILHVRDVASAFVDLLDSDVRGALDIGSGHAVTLREIVGEIARQIGRPDLVAFGAIEAPPHDPPRLVADATRLRNELGWKPRYTLETGLADAIAFLYHAAHGHAR